MQTGKQFYHSLITALSDKQIMDIINITSSSAKSMSEIISETGVPRTTVHRKINFLVDNGLLVVENFVIRSDGKKCKQFRSKLSSVKILQEENNICVVIGENTTKLPNCHDIKSDTTKHHFTDTTAWVQII